MSLPAKRLAVGETFQLTAEATLVRGFPEGTTFRVVEADKTACIAVIATNPRTRWVVLWSEVQ